MRTEFWFLVLLLLFVSVRPEVNFDIFGLENGELCIEGDQCNSWCCQKDQFLEIARCQAYTSEGGLCQGDGIWDVYTYCPCEMGLDCKKLSDGNKYCVDPYN